MSDEPDRWGRTSKEWFRGYCLSCKEWVESEPEYLPDRNGRWVVASWRLAEECEFCGSRLRISERAIVPLPEPPKRDGRGRFVTQRQVPAKPKPKRQPKPKPELRRQGHCPADGRFVPMNRMGRRRVYCNDLCKLRTFRAKA